ncbi:MAG TPA: pitrilysin family protein [Bacteroidia bacterium]|nr:pitrilysin family protein [Bacteroidia bacterium]
MKQFLKPFSYLLVALLLPIAAIPQTKPSQPSAPQKVTTVEGVTEYRLGNGLRVLLFPDPSKSTITVNITYLVGSRFEGYGESGMAHLLEHMVFKGTPNHPNIPQELSSHGARPNGTTWLDRTNYFETFSATDENLKWALSLESDRMVNSYIAKKDLDSEFSVVRNEFESGENDPSSVLMERVMSTAYLWHNYGKSTIGSREDIERVPIDNLKAFYQKYYQPDNSVLTIAGKIDEAKTIQLVNEYFGVIPKPTRVLQPTYTVEPTQDGERHVTLRRVGDVQVTSAGYHIPAGAHADYPAVEVLSDVLLNEPSGRLYKALVETKKATSVDGFAFDLKDPGFMYFSANVLKEKSLDDATKTMLDLLDNMKNTPVTQEETDRAKNKFLKYFEQTYNNSERVGLTLSEYIAKGDWRLWFYYRDQVEKVTAADVNRVVAAYLKPSNRTTGEFIPDANPDRAIITEAPDPAVLLKDYKGNTALKQAEEFDPSPANIMARTKTGSFKGGAKYAFLSKSTRGSAVNLSLTLRIGNEKALANKSKVTEFTASMLRRGTKNHTLQQLNDELDKIKSSVTISGSGQTVTVNLQSTKEQLIPALKLVQEILRTPTFPADELEKLREEEIAGIDEQRSEPRAIAGVEYNRIMSPYPSSDFRYTMNFDEEMTAVKDIKADELKKFYTDFYNAQNATVAVVGDFDEAAVKTALGSILNDWKSSVSFTRAGDSYFDVKATTKKINTPDKANAMMLAGTNLQLRDDDADYAALVMGNYMLGGGFLNSRLAVRIRQKEGISYGVRSYLRADPIDKSGDFGTFAIYNPTNSERLVTAYKEELDRMLKDGFTPEELKDAVSGYLQGRNVSRSQDRELVGSLANNLYLNRTMQWDADMEKKIAGLTVEQINEAMRRWIIPANLVIVEAGDFEKKAGTE